MPDDAAMLQATAAYRRGQQAISVDTIRQVIELWKHVNPADVDTAWPLVLAALRQTVSVGHGMSVALAVQYLRQHAAAAGVDVRPLVAATLPVAQVDTALTVTGPIATKVATRLGMFPTQAAQTALVRLSGSASRLALAGGRDTVARTVAGNASIPRWRRITSGNACDWCEMLAGRGSVYHTEDTAVGSQYHDHCACSAEPEYLVRSHARAQVRAPITSVTSLPRTKRSYWPEVDEQDHGLNLLHDMRDTNPRYGEPGYDVNCVHVVNAYELRRRGYDVTATPLPERFNSGRDSAEALSRWATEDGSQRKFSNTKPDLVDIWAEKLPPGARGWVRLSWTDSAGRPTGGGHIFNVERVKDGVRYVEAQSGRLIKLGDYMTSASKVQVVRVDDLVHTDSVLEFVTPSKAGD